MKVGVELRFTPEVKSAHTSGVNLCGIRFLAGKVTIDADGNITIAGTLTARSYGASSSARGTITITRSQGETLRSGTWIAQDWPVPPASIIVTPSYETKVWVTDISENGFGIGFEHPPTSPTDVIYWQAEW